MIDQQQPTPMQAMSRLRGLRQGFTLIELLVVISLIALLVAILLPALAQSRQQAYMASCLNNMKSMGLAINAYAGDNNFRIPPNAYNINSSAVTGLSEKHTWTYGAFTGNFYATALSAATIRYDKGTSGDPDAFNWTGLGILWMQDYIPYTLDGARTFWCAAEQRGSFKGSASGFSYGPGYYWNSLKNSRNACIGDIAGVNYTGYAYRGLGDNNPALALKKGNFDISNLGQYAAVIDYCTNIDGMGTASTSRKFVYAHGTDDYIGINRMWYDGHAKWFPDPSCVWRAKCPANGANPLGDTSYGNSYSQAMWNLYDTGR